jgi:GAF domain-containing protein
MAKHRIGPGRHTLIGRIAVEGRAVHVPDTLADAEHTWPEALRLGRIRSFLGVPLLREGTPIGALSVTRASPRPFADMQIELLTTFADQAVIAIENIRLLNELRQRTDDLSEALEQQTATSEVLSVISSSPGDLTSVFQVMLASATRLCEAQFGVLLRYDGAMFHTMAMLDVPPAFAELNRRLTAEGGVVPEPGTLIYRLLQTKTVVHIMDARAEPHPGPAAQLGGARSAMAVPMLKDDELVGAFVIYRQEVRPFTDKQIALVANFAAQAVIAIENTRLLNELHQRTADLSEALEQQTATSEVLSVISSSPGELEPVFHAMLENATHLCAAQCGNLILYTPTH